MYAVIKTGGKQYRVTAGDKIKVETLPGDVGAQITLSDVLMVSANDQIKIGTPILSGASVSATVVSTGRGDKVRIFKMRRRKHYQKRQGHRQNFSEIFITAISDGAGNTMSAQSAPVLKIKADDLTLVEGIGPKIATVLANNGITTFVQLAKTDPAAIEDMLKKSGGRFNMARPATWPQQAQLAATGEFDALKKLQDALHGGVQK